MGSDVFPEALREAGVTPRELEVFWLVGERLQNREIAEGLHLSERTVESHVSSLLRKLGGANRLALAETAARLRAVPAGGGPLPRPLSSFVGRTREAGDLARLVTAHRMLTLTGPAGTGKTRLALHLARSVTALPPAVLVDLAYVPPGDPVERAFADALGLSGDERRLRPLIRGALAGGPRWLVVDNCEHVAAGAAELLAELLAGTDGLHVLATSHGPLRVAGEVVYEVPPLPLPEEADDPSAVLEAAAARLFADRAAAVSPGFAVTSANARQVATICRRLDGLPLAIELAAARVRLFSPAELADRLDDRFALLTDGAHGAPSRHRTLEEALRWSYDLLDDGERMVLERCSVFPGEFDYDAAERILAYPPLDSDDLVRIFPRLLDRSLISSRRRTEITEYRLLDSVRQFAHRRLERRGAVQAAREQHARHHLRHGVAILPDLRGRDQPGALRWFNGRWADLRTAMRWALEQPDPAPAWEFLAGIGTGWEILGARGELFGWIDRLLERPPPQGALGVRAMATCALVLCYQDTERALDLARQAYERAGHADAADRTLALLTLGFSMRYGRDREAALEHLERAAAGFERLGDDWHRALALSTLGLVVPDTTAAMALLAEAAELFGRLRDDVKRANCLNHMALFAIEGRIRLDEAADWLTEATRLARACGNDHERLHAEVHRAALDQQLGYHAAARARFGGLVREFRRIGDLRCAARSLFGLGRAVAFTGDRAQARRHLREGVEVAIGLGDRYVTALGLLALAESDHAAGDLTRAATLLGAAERLAPHQRGRLDLDLTLRTALRDQLGAEGFGSALAAGRRASVDGLLSSIGRP